METYWKLNVEVVPEANGFVNVVSVVHWECFARQGDQQVRLYGAIDLPPPVESQSYVDLTTIQGTDEDGRRTIVLGWADFLRPGFVKATEIAVRERLQALLEKPALRTLTLI